MFHNTTKQPIGKDVDSILVPTGTLALIRHQPVKQCKQCKELSSRNWYFQIESLTNFLKHSNFKLIVFVIRNQCTNVELVMLSDVNYRSRDDRTDSLAVEKFSSSTTGHTIVVAFLQ